MLVSLKCPECKHTWTISADNDMEIVYIGIWDDICPICNTQADVYDLLEADYLPLESIGF